VAGNIAKLPASLRPDRQTFQIPRAIRSAWEMAEIW